MFLGIEESLCFQLIVITVAPIFHISIYEYRNILSPLSFLLFNSVSHIHDDKIHIYNDDRKFKYCQCVLWTAFIHLPYLFFLYK